MHDVPVTPDTLLVRAPGLTIKLGDADDVRIMRGEQHLESTPHALAILHAFAQPRQVGEVLAGLAGGPQHFVEISSTILQLAAAGVLSPPGLLSAAPRGYASPTMHVVMLDDEPRTRRYIEALHAVVHDGDVVVDIGTGTGVLATTAAKSGARRVHAIESSAIANAAERVFAANGVADRVGIVRGRSTEVTLPERADVLVTEMIGNDPLDEHLLEIVSDAKARLLREDARLIPSAIEIFAQAVALPRRLIERHVFTPERLAAWQALYGLDFSPLAEVRRGPTQSMSVRTEEFLAWPRVASAVSLASIDLTGPFEVVRRASVAVTLTHDVERLGVVLAFRATLAPGNILSTLAEEVHPTNHWRYAMWPAREQVALSAGAVVTIDYAYDRGVTSLEIGPSSTRTDEIDPSSAV